ncbi:MAG: hypothetical protein ACJ764_15070 [Solirubrobacteraceae bacterium]
MPRPTEAPPGELAPSDRRRYVPSRAMIVALVALLVAMSGSAYAVSSTINGSQLTNRSVAAIKLTQHTLTGIEINKSRLGLVPSAGVARNAHALGGIGPTGFVHGPGRRSLAHLTLTPSSLSDHELLKVPGLVDVHASCVSGTDPPQLGLGYTNISGTTLDVVRSILTHDTAPIATDGFSLAPLAQAENTGNAALSDVMRFGAGSGAGARVAVVTTWANNAGGNCQVGAEADYSH